MTELTNYQRSWVSFAVALNARHTDMAHRPVDELIEDHEEDIQPQKELEPFYILAALEFGDPDQKDWLINAHTKFYDFWRNYQDQVKCYLYSGPAVALQFLLWYERERSRLTDKS